MSTGRTVHSVPVAPATAISCRDDRKAFGTIERDRTVIRKALTRRIERDRTLVRKALTTSCASPESQSAQLRTPTGLRSALRLGPRQSPQSFFRRLAIPMITAVTAPITPPINPPSTALGRSRSKALSRIVRRLAAMTALRMMMPRSFAVMKRMETDAHHSYKNVLSIGQVEKTVTKKSEPG